MGDRYHPIYEAVWRDVKFHRFQEPWLARAFFVYLCSHDRTAPAGIYAVTPEILAAETGRPLRWVQETLARASTEGLVRVHDGVLWVVRYFARQPNRKGEAYQLGVVAALKRLGLVHPICQEFLDTYKTLGRPLADPRLRLARASPEPPPHPTSGIRHPASSIPHPETTTSDVGEARGSLGGASGEPQRANGFSAWPPEWDPLKAKIEALPFLRQHAAWLDDLAWWITLDEWLTSAPKPLDELLADAVAHIVSSGYIPRTKNALRAKIKNCLHTAGRIAEREAQTARPAPR